MFVATLTIFALLVPLGLLALPVPDGVPLAPPACRSPHPAMPSTTTSVTSQATFRMPYLGDNLRLGDSA